MCIPLAFAPIAAATGQLVTPKTVPVHQDEQFAIFPTLRAGMAGVSIALDDTLADPFANPAKAARVRGATLFSAPLTHGVSAGRAGGNTLPVGAIATRGSWSLGTVVAIQQLAQAAGNSNAIGDRTASNRYGSFVVAHRLGNGLAIGASGYIADLNAIDGVDLLYAGSDKLAQSGTVGDVRLGLVRDADRRHMELVLVHNRTHMTQDVHFTRYTWVPATNSVQRSERAEHNVDATNIWGAHAQYAQEVGTEGWRLGALATANRLSHPKIPNYSIQNIPRDPGTTYAYNIGVGAARVIKGMQFGVDLIDEPMFSRTWGTAGADTATASGGVLHAGDRTVDNRFIFSNGHLRVGVGREFVSTADTTQALGFQLGLGVYSIKYRLHQANHVGGFERVADEGWTEWTPTLGIQWRNRDFTLVYAYRRTCGPSACVDIGMGDKVTVPAPVTNGGIIAAPTSPLWIEGGVSHAHQIVLVIPIR